MKSVKFTLKAWPVITVITMALCFATQGIAKLFGIELPDQQNLDIVRRWVGWNKTFALLCAQILILMPALEEIIFRWALYRLPKKLPAHEYFIIAISSALFTAAHYIAQPWPDAAFLALFFFGIAQCWLYRRTGSLWCAMLNHALFNLTNLVLMFVIPV